MMEPAVHLYERQPRPRVNVFVTEWHRQPSGLWLPISHAPIHNLVVAAGRNLIRDLVNGDSINGITHLAVGTSTTAVADGDARQLYWFLDSKLLGRADSTEPFYWTPAPGRFTVRAVDNHGRSDAQSIRVVVVE